MSAIDIHNSVLRRVFLPELWQFLLKHLVEFRVLVVEDPVGQPNRIGAGSGAIANRCREGGPVFQLNDKRPWLPDWTTPAIRAGVPQRLYDSVRSCRILDDNWLGIPKKLNTYLSDLIRLQSSDMADPTQVWNPKPDHVGGGGYGGQGPDGDFAITSFSRNEALEEAITVRVTAKLAAFRAWIEAA